jgi:hypothetical protein
MAVNLMDSRALLLLTIVLTLLTGQTAAVRCYKCNSLENNGCGSTLSYYATCYSSSTCLTFTGTLNGRYVILRDCLSTTFTGCTYVDTTYKGNRVIGNYCYCRTNYCNASVASTAVRVSAKLGLLIAFASIHFWH